MPLTAVGCVDVVVTELCILERKEGQFVVTAMNPEIDRTELVRRTEMELLTQRLASLLTVKSLVTVILTAVFAAMAGTGRVTAEQFLTVFTVVIAFYFGTQAEKRARE